MPVTARIIPALSLVHVVYSGPVTLQEVREAAARTYAQPDYRPGMTEIGDLRAIGDISVGFGEMRAFAADIRAGHAARMAPMTLCLVAPEALARALSDMFRALVGSEEPAPAPMMDIHIVQGYPEVLATLDLPPQALQHFPPNCRDEAHLM